jgi:hypothetical protein
MKAFFEESFIRITFEKELNAVKAIWMDSPTSEEFREGMDQIIEAFKAFKTGILLSDTVNIGVISPKDQLWASADWIKRAVPAGYSQFAVIASSDVFTQISVEDILTPVKLNNDFLKIQYFGNEDLARQWIRKTNLHRQPESKEKIKS